MNPLAQNLGSSLVQGNTFLTTVVVPESLVSPAPARAENTVLHAVQTAVRRYRKLELLWSTENSHRDWSSERGQFKSTGEPSVDRLWEMADNPA